MKRIFFGLILLVTSCLSVLSVPAYTGVIKHVQPDGTELEVYLYGDEYGHFATTVDGYLLELSDDGGYRYAGQREPQVAHSVSGRSLRERMSKKQVVDSAFLAEFTQKTAQRRGAMQQSTPAKVWSGVTKGIVILAEFSNLEFTTSNPQQAFSDMLNQSGYSANGGTGSARDYFIAASDSVYLPEFDVVGPVKLSNPYNYYGENDDSGNDKNATVMISEACRLAHEAGVDFSQYDGDGDGVVDALFVYYAGHNEAEGGPAASVWPHKFQISMMLDGVWLRTYACTSELSGRSGSTMCGIGTFCHETSHVYGLPDLYVTDYGHNKNTVGSWDIMCSGSYNNSGKTPPTWSAYERFYVGWLTPKLLNAPSYVELSSLLDSNEACIITSTRNHNLNGGNPSPNQFIILENRQQKSWDKYLSGHGLLATRVVYSASAWNYNTVNNDSARLGVCIIPAYAKSFDTASDPYPGSKKVTTFFPSGRTGEDWGQPITFIEEKDGVISFRYDGGGDGYATFDDFPAALEPFHTEQQVASAAQSVKVAGRWLVEPVTVSFANGENYEMAQEGDPVQWGKALTLTPAADSTLNANVLVRYFPEVASHGAAHRDTLLLNLYKYDSKNSNVKEIALTGTSNRPILVETPVAQEATEVSSSAFVANWNSAFDATGYYLTVWQRGNENVPYIQTFDDMQGDDVPCDWDKSSCFYFKTIYGAAAPSVALSTDADTLLTERYAFPITKLTFWLHSVSASGSVIKLEAFDGEWHEVESITIDKTTKQVTREVALPQDNAYSRFRFTYKKKAGDVLIDDFTVHFAENISAVRNHQFVPDTTQEVNNLPDGSQYVYAVQATDKTEYYEHITDYSNMIAVATTTAETTEGSMIIRKTATGYQVQLEALEPAAQLYIFDANGHFVASVTPQSTTVDLPVLVPHRVYVVKYTTDGKIHRKTLVGKFFYEN